MLFFFAKLFSSWPPEFHIIDLAIQAVSALVLALLLLIKREEGMSLLALFGICLALTLHNILFVGTESLEASVQLCVAATAGCHLFFNGLSKRTGRTIFWVTVLIICILMAFSIDGYFLFPFTLSRNYASVFLLMAYVCLASSRESVPELEMFLSSAMCLFISIRCVGRGGILATALLVLCCLVAFLRLFPPRIRRTTSVILVIVGALAFAYLALVMGDNFLERFSPDPTTNTSDAHRLSMLNSYLRYTFNDPRHLIFGFDPLDTHNGQIMNHAGNVHNSFLQFHSCFGLIPLILLVASVWQGIRGAMRKKKPYLAAALTAFFARALLDWMFPLSYADFVVFLSVSLFCERLLPERWMLFRKKEVAVEPAEERHAYAVCTPLQLFGAIQVRNQLLSEHAVPADLFLYDEFKGARDAAETLRNSKLFDRVFLVPEDFPTGSLPMVREYLRLIFLEGSCRKKFNDVFPVGEAAYSEFFCANPRNIIFLKWFAAQDDSHVNLLYEGMGSYAGTIMGYFTIKNSTVAPQFRSKLKKQVLKQDLKGVLECLDTRGFFFDPVRMFVIDDLPELHEMYPGMEIVPMIIDPGLLTKMGGYFSIVNPELYSANKVFFLGTHDNVVPSAVQFDLAAAAARALGCTVVFRAHPKNPSVSQVDEGIVLDETGNLWELVCFDGMLDQDAVLIGFASTAQFQPKQLLGQEPLIISLQLLMEPSIIRDRLDLAARLVERTYSNKQRMFIPSTVEEYEEALAAIRAGWKAENR